MRTVAGGPSVVSEGRHRSVPEEECMEQRWTDRTSGHQN